MERAPIILAGAIALGIAGQLLFFKTGVGINVPIAIATLVLAGWWVKRPGARVERMDMWLGPTAIVFASFAAVRADPTIVTFDILTSLGLAGAALASFGRRSVVRRPFLPLLRLGSVVAAWILTGATVAIRLARRRLPADVGRGVRAGPMLPVLRGLLLAAPLAAIFLTLFTSADAVFARAVADVADLDVDLDDAIGRVVVGAALGWIAAGGLALAASRPSIVARPVVTNAGGWRIGTTEAVTVLIVVDALFVAFVAVQGAYLFGGADTMGVIGMTYSDYARRGFFELVAVTILAVGLIVALDRLVRTRARPFIVAAATLTGLTAVVLVSAGLRMGLYQDAYGWTELRLYVVATILVVGVVLAGLVVALLTDRVRWIGHVALVAGLVVGLALNVLGPTRFITEQNVARALDPSLVPPNGRSGLDTWYVLSLGDDAIPELLRALPALPAVEADDLRSDLRTRLNALESDAELATWQAWNLGRERARAALASAAANGDLD